MTGIVDAIFKHAGDVTATVLLLFIVVALGYVVWAFAFGKIPTPGEHKRLLTRCDLSDETLKTVTAELADARVLHAAATVRIEFLELENRRKDAEVQELRLRVIRLETENEMRRAKDWRDTQEGHTP